MRRELLTPDNKGVEVIMVEWNSDPVPPRTPITVVVPARWADAGNAYVVGNTVFAETAGYAGGLPDTTTYRWRIQTRDSAQDEWVNGSWFDYTDHGEEVSFPLAASGDICFQCEARDKGLFPYEYVNSFASIQTVETPSTLVYSNPVATGEPWVGETLSCSEPVVTGGVGPYQFDYSWVDETNAIIWDTTYMGNTTTVVADDIGKMMKCLVQITDKGWSGGESITVESNSIGPVRAPLIGDLTTKVDGQPYDWDKGMFIETMNGAEHLVLIERNGEPGVSYTWIVKQGQARLTPSSGSCIVIIQSAPPQGVQIQCDLINKNASDNPKTVRFPFFVGES